MGGGRWTPAAALQGDHSGEARLPLPQRRSAPRRAPQRQHSERTAPKRPRAGGKCAAIWDHLDANPDMQVKELREVAVARGWNVNNAVCELYAWRRYTAMTTGQN